MVSFKPLIETTGWRVEEVVVNKERVRDLFVLWHQQAWQVAHARA